MSAMVLSLILHFGNTFYLQMQVLQPRDYHWWCWRLGVPPIREHDSSFTRRSPWQWIWAPSSG